MPVVISGAKYNKQTNDLLKINETAWFIIIMYTKMNI